ncbi:LAFA_0D01178g1_1 [Lachancea sp. 'fantastica']|nr:LAFA_0D01178g1_1 [Lachancea sp. 'fantastica']
MGVPALWEFIKTDDSVRRIPFKQLVTEFKTDAGRTPRLAIDAFGWLFECGFYAENGVNDSPSKSYGGDSLAIISLFKRVNALIALDVTFVLVFDGPSKPEFKNRAKLKKVVETESKDANYETAEQVVDGTGALFETQPYELDDTLFPDKLNLVKRFLKAMNISWIDASGEGEAECARLQKLGLVDYIITNDSDAFVFGATKVLRNLSRFWEDVPASYAGSTKKKDHKESFVTIFDISELRNWNQDQIVLFYALLGADYSQGVRGLGPKKSATLALLREPDFASEFTSIFKDPHLDPRDRQLRYKAFQDKVFKHSQANSNELFGRNYFRSSSAENFQGWPSEAALMHYFHPVLSSTVDLASVGGDFINISGNLTLDEQNFRQLIELLSEHNIRSISNLRKWFHESTHNAFILKKLLQFNGSDSSHFMKITDEWTSECCQGVFHIEYWRIRYNTFLPGVEEPQIEDFEGRNLISRPATSSRKTSPTKKQLERATYKYMASVPKKLVPVDHPLVLEYCLEREKVRNTQSPRKRAGRKPTPQKNNLDDFLKTHTSPRRKLSSTDALESVAQRLEALPTKRQLFVGEEPDLDESDDPWVADTSSLILVSEHECQTECAPTSPKRGLLLTQYDEESNSGKEERKESPLKKRHITTTPARNRAMKNPILSQHIDLTNDSDG